MGLTPDMKRVSVIVEGHGEEVAVPILFKKIFQHLGLSDVAFTDRPIRSTKGNLTSGNAQFFQHLRMASNQVRSSGGVVVIIVDADENCPKELSDLVKNHTEALHGVPILFCAIVRAYESWILSSWSTVSSHQYIDEKSPIPDSIGSKNPKVVLQSRMSRRYAEREQQEEFTRLIDVNLARANPSFDRLVRRLEEILKPAP